MNSVKWNLAQAKIIVSEHALRRFIERLQTRDKILKNHPVYKDPKNKDMTLEEFLIHFIRKSTFIKNESPEKQKERIKKLEKRTDLSRNQKRKIKNIIRNKLSKKYSFFSWRFVLSCINEQPLILYLVTCFVKDKTQKPPKKSITKRFKKERKKKKKGHYID